jgi:hypothetical protein
MLQRFFQLNVHQLIRQIGLILLVLMPVQNVIGQIMTGFLGLPAAVLLWKEGLLILLGGLMFVVTVRSLFKNEFKPSRLRLLAPVTVYAGIVLLAMVASFVNQVPLRELALGFRVELLWVGVLAVGFSYVLKFKNQLDIVHTWLKMNKTGIYIGYFILLVVILASLAVGQTRLFGGLGFSDGWGTSDNLVLDSPLCHSIDSAGNGCRLSGGFASPNYLAGYLLLIWPYFLLNLFTTWKNGVGRFTRKIFWLELVFAASIPVWLVLTYARFALLAVMAMAGLAIIIAILQRPGKTIRNTKWLKTLLRSTGIAIFSFPLIFLTTFMLIGYSPALLNSLPGFLAKPGSTLGHYKQTSAALEIVTTKQNIWLIGYGLGQVGTVAKPQYKNVENTKIVQENLDVAQKLNIPPYELPVPENWYLQLVLNGGVVYAGLYLGLVGLVLLPIFLILLKNKALGAEVWVLSLGLYGIFVGNLFLHIWENQTIAIYFVLLSITLGLTFWKHETKNLSQS